jgi:integrase
MARRKKTVRRTSPASKLRRLTPRFLVRKGALLYWQPPKYLRELGLAPERLPEDPLAARQRAEALNAKADAVRLAARRAARATKGQPAAAADLNPHRPGTVSWLIHRWAGDIEDRNTPGASPDWRRLAEQTRRTYRRYLQALRGDFGHHRIKSLTPRVLHAYKTELSDPHTGLMTRANRYQMQVLQTLLAFAVRMGELEANPASKLRLSSNPPRRAYWTEESVAQFLAADPPPSIRLALMLGLHTGQRQADILHLRWSDITDGWITLEQRKSRRAGRTAKRVAIPIGQVLAAELAKVERGGVQVVISETTRRPYRENHFRHVWRAATVKAGLDGLQFLDLRRAAVVRMAEAGCEVGHIASWTGHSISETAAILNTYFVPTRKAAEAALVKLEAAFGKEAQPENER